MNSSWLNNITSSLIQHWRKNLSFKNKGGFEKSDLIIYMILHNFTVVLTVPLTVDTNVLFLCRTFCRNEGLPTGTPAVLCAALI